MNNSAHRSHEMNNKKLLMAIETYRTNNGGYDIGAMMKAFGIEQPVANIFFELTNPDWRHPDPRIAAAMDVNAALYDAEQAAKQAALDAAWQRWQAGTACLADCLLLERKGILVAIYGDPESNRPTGFRLAVPQGNQYTDQAGLEENPGRL